MSRFIGRVEVIFDLEFVEIGIRKIAASFFQRHALKVVAIQIVLAPIVLLAAVRVFSDAANKAEDWLPESFAETKQLEWFKEHFVADDLLAVSWEGCTIDDPNCEKLANLLNQPIDVGGGAAYQLTRQVVIPKDALAQLRDEPLRLSKSVALKRLRGWLVGEDGKNCMILVFLTPEGWEHREFLLDHLFSTVSSLTGLPHESIHIAGSTVDSISVDRASKKYMDEMLVASYILSFILMYGVFRSTILAAMVFVDSYFCQQISLALIYITGAEMDSVMLIVPSLVYVLAVSTGVHLISYYRNALTSVAANEASRTALRHAIVPCTLSTTTTAVGLISLMVSSLVPVDKFAFYAALGVVVSTTTLFLIVPSQLELISRLKNAKQRFCSSEGSRGRWQSLRDRVGNARHPIFIVTAIIFVVSLAGITKLKSSAGIHDQFRASEKIIQDYQWFEESLGPLVPIEVVLRLPKRDGDNSMSMADRLRYVAVAHNLVGRQEEIGAVVSAASFSPTMKRRRRGASAVAKESVLNKELEKHSGRYVDMSLLQYTEEEELWRISARSYATRKIDYDRVLTSLREGLEKITQKFEAQEHKDAIAVVCGGVPLVRKTQRQMLIDLKEGFMVAVALITAMMIALAISSASHELLIVPSMRERGILLLSRVGAGGVAMIPNVLPCIAMFGAMGMAEVPMDIGSLLTASVALGIAVDDTLHFISWVYRSLANGSTREEAVLHAYQHCGPAMIRTSLICGLGLLVYAYSPFIPIARFAWLMFSMLLAALAGDLIVLPALLLSRLGRLFEPHLLSQE